MIVIFYEGFSGSCKGASIAEIYTEMIKEEHGKDDIIFMQLQSSDLSYNKDKRLIKAMFEYRMYNKFLFIGKSLGGVKTYDLINDLLQDNSIHHDADVKVILIDAHAIGDRFDEHDPFTLSDAWKHQYIKTANFFQHNEYPRGAKCTNPDYEKDYTNILHVDHMTIVNQFEIANKIKDFLK